jgi:RecJ-like exonuclease
MGYIFTYSFESYNSTAKEKITSHFNNKQQVERPVLTQTAKALAHRQLIQNIKYEIQGDLESKRNLENIISQLKTKYQKNK